MKGTRGGSKGKQEGMGKREKGNRYGTRGDIYTVHDDGGIVREGGKERWASPQEKGSGL